MENERKSAWYIMALVIYLDFIIYGMGLAIIAQYKQQFANHWGAERLADGVYDTSSVVAVIAVFFLGSGIGSFLGKHVRDAIGYKACTLIGICCDVVYLSGIVWCKSSYPAGLCALAGGAAMAFMDNGFALVTMDRKYKPQARRFIKIVKLAGIFALPALMSYMASNFLPYTAIFYLMSAALLGLGFLLVVLPIEEETVWKKEEGELKKQGLDIKKVFYMASGIAGIMTFLIWLSTNQELGRLYGMDHPERIQSWLATGVFFSICCNWWLLKREKYNRFRPLWQNLFQMISAIALAMVYGIKSPAVLMACSFIIGSSLGGNRVENIMSCVPVAVSVSAFFSLAISAFLIKAGGIKGPQYVVLLNIIVTVVGVLLAIYVNIYDIKRKKVDSKEQERRNE